MNQFGFFFLFPLPKVVVYGGCLLAIFKLWLAQTAVHHNTEAKPLWLSQCNVNYSFSLHLLLHRLGLLALPLPFQRQLIIFCFKSKGQSKVFLKKLCSRSHKRCKTDRHWVNLLNYTIDQLPGQWDVWAYIYYEPNFLLKKKNFVLFFTVLHDYHHRLWQRFLPQYFEGGWGGGGHCKNNFWQFFFLQP